MKNIALGALIAGFLAACGGGGDDIAVTDAAPDTTPSIDGGTCNPLSPAGSQGCATGEKCTWISVTDTPARIGKTGCVPDGTVALGGACTRGMLGETTGYDTCAAGGYCIYTSSTGGFCQDICGFDNGANSACATGFACTRYSGLFANGMDDPIAGACKPTCDPLTQTITGGGSCPNGEGCYPFPMATTTVAVCAGTSPTTHGQTIPPEDLSMAGNPFINSCAPLHFYRPRGPTDPTWECGGLCQPADVTSTTNMTLEGGTAAFNCEARGASAPDSATAGESCRYFWAREPAPTNTPYSNTLGFCWKHATDTYDSNGDGMDDLPMPRCITLTTGDVVPPIGNPMHNDALYFWCVAQPSALQGAVSNVKKWFPGANVTNTVRSLN